MACAEGVCIPEGCVPGQNLHCACNGGACSGDLSCDAELGLCKPAEGRLGHACTPEGTCFEGRCSNHVCVPCLPGSQACQCGSGCAHGLECIDQMCQSPHGLSDGTVSSQYCFTPCSRGTTLDGVYTPCSSEGLMPGCLGDTTCIAGQCVVPDEGLRTCQTDVDCPDHQACLTGICSSNCQTDDQCLQNSVCHRHVCRPSCSTEGSANCAPGTFCSTTDGEQGVCMPRASAPPPTGPTEIALFEVDVAHIDLNTSDRSGIMTLTNHFDRPATFMVRKTRSRILTDRDPIAAELECFREPCEVECVGSTCPLYWLEVVDGNTTSRHPITTVTLEAGESRPLLVRVVDGFDEARWEGNLQVFHPEYGAVDVGLSYAKDIGGSWGGSIYTFGNFNTGQ
ncbi:MAG: hypothetical protein AAFX99_34970, partial [Myxococcota bacterium]